MGTVACQMTSLTIVYSTVYLGADQRKHQISASLAFVWGIHRWPVNSPHKGPVTRKMFPFDDVIMPCVIQIKIWAEYRDMLPRPRLVCQEPELRPIGRSPGVPDNSSLGSMSRYSAQILICFIAYIFLFYSSVDLVGNFAGLLTCTVPSGIVHCNQKEAGHQTIKTPSIPCWGSTGTWKHSLAFMPQDWWNWQIKWMKSVSSVGSFQYKNQVNGEFFCIPVSIFIVFQPRI